MHRIGVRRGDAHRDVAGLVDGGGVALVGSIMKPRRSSPISTRSRARSMWRTLDRVRALARGEDGGLVEEVRQIGAGEAGRAAGDVRQVDGGGERDGRACTLRISLRPRRSGSGTTICRSKRPGRRIAGSRMSARLVEAITTMPRRVVEAVHLDQELVQGLVVVVGGRVGAACRGPGPRRRSRR